MRRLLRIALAIGAVLSLALCVTIISFRMRGDFFLGRSWVADGWEPQTPSSVVSGEEIPPPGFSILHFHEGVTLIAVIDGELWLSEHVATYESWAISPAPREYTETEALARSRQGLSWHVEGYGREACPALGWRDAGGSMSSRELTVAGSWRGVAWYRDVGSRNSIYSTRVLGARYVSFLPRSWRVRAIRVPLSTTIVVFAVLPLAQALLLTRRVLIKRRALSRRSAGHCVRCDYDLRATPGICPECGLDASADEAIGRQDNVAKK